MFTSKFLIEKEIYTREELQNAFKISDATINTGIFKPRDHYSIWLFVTEEKTPDRTQYLDFLEGDTLKWDGQLSGKKDKLITNHKKNNQEIIVFYRKSKNEFGNYAFRYLGKFEYISSNGRRPTHFILKKFSITK